MLKLRTIILSTLLTIVIATGSYFAVMAVSAKSGVTTSGSAISCPVVHSTYLSNQDLWRILNGRFDRRIRLPY